MVRDDSDIRFRNRGQRLVVRQSTEKRDGRVEYAKVVIARSEQIRISACSTTTARKRHLLSARVWRRV